jgi:hypothetical protein
MKLEREYRWIYGVWQYVERILGELGASLDEVRESGSEHDKLVKIYEAKLSDAAIRAEVDYEKKDVSLISPRVGKIAFTNVIIDVTSDSPERENEIIDYFSKRLALYTLRGAG